MKETLTVPRERTPEAAEPLEIRVCTAAEGPAILEFAQSPGAHMVYHPRHPLWSEAGPGEAASAPLLVVAAWTPQGTLAGAAWLEPERPSQARLIAFARLGLARGDVTVELLRETAARARRLGFPELVTSVYRDTHDPFDDFRAAGLRVTSSISLGGVTDVTLDVP